MADNSSQDLELLKNILDKGISPDKQSREQSEKLLMETAKTNPSGLVESLVQCLCLENTPSHLKKIACVWLQKILCIDQNPFPELYAKVSEEAWNNFKKGIFVAIEAEKAADVQKQLANTIGQVGSLLINDEEVAKGLNAGNKDLWPELVTFDLLR